MIKTKSWVGGAEEEYETQHFGFGSQRLKIAVRKMVEQKITSGVKEMASCLQQSLDLNDTDKATLTRSSDKLIRLYCDRAGPSLDVIDGEIERILKVPSNVLLPGDECQLEQISDAEYKKLKDEVALLRKRVERAAIMEVLLTAEEKELTTVENVCESAKNEMDVIDFICKKSKSNAKASVNETLFLCSNAKFMKKSDYVFL